MARLLLSNVGFLILALVFLAKMSDFWINLLVVAVIPDLCEEMLFRGMIYKGLENQGRSPKRAILLSGILFGSMYIDFIRMIPKALLGMGFAYALYKSSFIFLCSLCTFSIIGLLC